MPQIAIDPIEISITLVKGLDMRYKKWRNAGWVYAARNVGDQRKVLKIGQTKVSPKERIAQLSAS